MSCILSVLVVTDIYAYNKMILHNKVYEYKFILVNEHVNTKEN